MSKIFSVNYNRSINDKYGATATLGAASKVRRDEKGLALQMNSNSTEFITYGDISAVNSIGTGEFSVVVGVNIKGFLNHGSADNSIFAKTTSSSTNGFSLFYQATNTYFSIVTTNLSTGSLEKNKNNLIIVTRNSAGLCTIYVNGIQKGTPTTQAGNISNAGLVVVGSDNNAARTPNASIYLSEVYNHCLTEVEIQKLVADFQAQMPVSKPKRGFVYPKPTDLSKVTGLVAGYNMVPNGTTLVDISGNGNNLALGVLTTGRGPVATKNGLSFTRDSYYFKDLANGVTMGTGSHTHSVRVKLLSYPGSGYAYIAGIGDDIAGYASVLGVNATGKIMLSCYSNPLAESTSTILNLNQEYTVSAVLANQTVSFYIDGVFAETVAVAYNVRGTVLAINTHMALGAAMGNQEIIDYRLYNRALSVQEIKDYHNQFAKQVVLNECFCDSSADNLPTVPREWIAGTGTYKVVETTTDEGNYGGIKKGTKYLQNVTAGTVVLPSNVAYGTWEFDWYKGADSNSFRVLITKSNMSPLTTDGTGYLVTPANSETLGIYRATGSGTVVLIETASAYVANNTWYRLKITRSNAGIFTLYIKGGAFTPTVGANGWTLVSASGGSGTNPVTDNTYTTSNYVVLDLDAGDRFANLVIRNGVVV